MDLSVDLSVARGTLVAVRVSVTVVVSHVHHRRIAHTPTVVAAETPQDQARSDVDGQAEAGDRDAAEEVNFLGSDKSTNRSSVEAWCGGIG
jgi:hypothetical protein